jgi:hypothetical protein
MGLARHGENFRDIIAKQGRVGSEQHIAARYGNSLTWMATELGRFSPTPYLLHVLTRSAERGRCLEHPL